MSELRVRCRNTHLTKHSGHPAALSAYYDAYALWSESDRGDSEIRHHREAAVRRTESPNLAIANRQAELMMRCKDKWGVSWQITPRVSQMKEALDSTQGFTFLLGGAKIWLEHGIEPRFVLCGNAL